MPEPLSSPTESDPLPAARSALSQAKKDLMPITKARLSLLVVVTTLFFGFYLFGLDFVMSWLFQQTVGRL